MARLHLLHWPSICAVLPLSYVVMFCETVVTLLMAVRKGIGCATSFQLELQCFILSLQDPSDPQVCETSF
uniref:Uncharacterized protein n=1 Tax=Octopus bimaculoides TaxID=37653 RepID=A0A0L8FT73_OCTBM